MCQNCNCDFFDRCSIVGYMPIGFCCENCYLYDEERICLKSKTKIEDKKEPRIERVIKLENASIEGELLKVRITQTGEKEKILLIDLKKYLES
ncbi:MAG: hypothetical protein ACFFFT_03660 [Candidatus Thorarchaeota archaeon]